MTPPLILSFAPADATGGWFFAPLTETHMGYYVILQHAEINIPQSLFPTLCSHLLTSRFIRPENMGGGCYGGPEGDKRWFSWVDMDQLNKALADNDFYRVLECFRFEPITNEAGDIIDLHFDCKCGDEEKLFEHLAPVLPGTTRLTWQGENGEQWRYVIKDGKFKWVDGITTFPGDED